MSNAGQQPSGQQPYGQQYGQPYGGPVGAPPSHQSSVTSLVLGILSLVMCGFLTGIPAMIVGRRAKRQIAASHGQLGGDGLATAGFVTGLIGTLLSGVGFLLVILVFALGGVIHSSFQQSCTTVGQNGQTHSC